MKYDLNKWLETEEGTFWEEKAHQSVDEGDGYYDDIIYHLFTAHANIEDFEVRTINYKEIPNDLEEMIDEGEFVHGNFSKIFENAMFFHGLMEHGTYRRSHRIITEKCINLGMDSVIELLTGKSSEELEKDIQWDNNQEDLATMYRLANRFGYKVTKV